MVLTPASFDSAPERDAFFARRSDELEALSDAERRHGKENCGGAYCTYLLSKTDAAHKVRLERLEAERLQVVIRQR